MLNFNKKSLIFFIFSLLALYSQVTYSYEVDIKADSLTYQQDSGIINASGNVKLDWLGKILQADNIEMRIQDKQLEAEGHVVISEEANTIYSDKISYDIDNESGTMEDTLACSSSIYLRAEKMIKESSTTYRIENVVISNCDLDSPHSYAYAKEGIFVVDKKITIYKATYYVGGVPIFYFPKYTRNLGGSDSKFSYEIEPGYSNQGGPSAKVKLKYKFNKHFDTSLLYDYLGKIGNGVGLEANYYERDKIKATIFGYGAKYDIEDSQRWMVKPSYWQQINDYWKIQAHGEFVSDSYFNNKYQLADWDRVLNKRKSYASVTRQTAKSNLRLVSELYQIYNPLTDEIQAGSYLKLPEVHYTLYPIKTFGLYSNLTANVENRYNYEYTYNDKTYDYHYVTANVDYNLTNDYKINKNLTIKPTVGIREDYYSNRNPEDDAYKFVTRYYSSLNTRYRLTYWMDWNLAYNIKLRTSENSLALDNKKIEIKTTDDRTITYTDNGIETNNVMFNNYMYFSSNIIVRNITGYDFRKLNNKELGYVDWYPFITEITYTPTSKFTLYLKQQQGLDPFEFNSVQLDTTIGQLEHFYINFGTYYYSTSSDIISFVAGIGFWLNAKWRFDYVIRNKYSIEDHGFYGHDQEFRLYRDLHCFNLGASFRLREDYYELYFKFEMKANVPTYKKKDGTKEIDQEFYPWR